jgi:23S rRNA-/tRNA-specific pseudouridylate synthase
MLPSIMTRTQYYTRSNRVRPKVDLDYTIKDGDVLTHMIHRHRPAVAASSQDGVKVLEETDELMVVVNKPGILPVHPFVGWISYEFPLTHSRSAV